jgi:hypothetical protein
MTLNEWILLGASITSLIVAIGGIGALVRDRRKPELDAAQAANALVSSESVKAEIKRMSDETNLNRDQRIWALEQFVDKARPYFRQISDVVDELCHRLKVEVEKTGGTMPAIVVPDPPAIPPPLTMPERG